VLEEVRFPSDIHKENGRSAHQVVLEKEKSLPTKSKPSSDKYGFIYA